MSDTKEPFAPGAVRGYIRFGVPAHEIDSLTLAVALIETGNLLNRMGAHIAPDNAVAFRVRGFQSGSFEFAYDVRAILVPTLLTVQPALPFLKQTFDMMIQFLRLKQALKGEPLKQKDGGHGAVTVIGDRNTTVCLDAKTINLYMSDGAAHQAASRQFRALSEDETVEAYEILNQNRTPVLRIPRPDFPLMATAYGGDPDDRSPRIDEEETVLIIMKPLLEKKHGTWSFVDGQGVKLSAAMKDDEFLTRVENREHFAMGDRLRVRLRVKKEYNNGLGTHVITKREIIRVLEHIHQPEQTQFPHDQAS